MNKSPLIFDYQSTTPCDSEVLKVMKPYWNEVWGNPSNRNNSFGIHASAAISVARETIAKCLNTQAERVIFTSGATEANNLALLGHARSLAQERGSPGHLVTVSTEHYAVLEPLRRLEREGFTLTVLRPKSNGLISLDQVANALQKNTFLVSVMMANNEIGVLQPVASIGELCSDKGITFHSDAAQALGYMNVNLGKLKLDFMSISGHKIYGPKGIGALISPTCKPITPLIWGGGSDKDIRPGTIPVPLVMGFAKAMELANLGLSVRNKNLKYLRDLLFNGLKKNISEIKVNGCLENRLPHNLNITIKGIKGNRLHQELRNKIACTSGSACSNGKPSHVLRAIGLTNKEAEASLRLSIGRETKKLR